MSLIYLLYDDFITKDVYVFHFYYLSAWVRCVSLVSIRRIIYKLLNVRPFDFTAFVVNGKVGIP